MLVARYSVVRDATAAAVRLNSAESLYWWTEKSFNGYVVAETHAG